MAAFHQIFQRGIAVSLDPHIQPHATFAGTILQNIAQAVAGGGQQQLAVGKAIKGNRLIRVQVGPRRTDQIQDFLQQGLRAQRPHRTRFKQDRHVNFAPVQPIQQIAGIGADDADGGIGVAGAKRRHQRHRQNIRHGRRHADGNMTAQGGILVRDRGADFLQFTHDAMGVAQHLLPGLCYHHAATVAVKQPDTEFILQQPDLTAERGLGDVQAVGGLGQAAQFRDVYDGAQL
ncbi:MAG: hypothetical protein ACD_54C00971G0004 [uncultured bacterium]|nr:MAG: hypothetical protein ACD_54C00971G0004 [uncultured bacterium]